MNITPKSDNAADGGSSPVACSPSDTPETDAAIALANDPDGAPEVCDLCQKLERERHGMEIRHAATMMHTQTIVDEANALREQMRENPWCAACREPDCCVSGDGTCAMIRKYLSQENAPVDAPAHD